MEEVRAAKSDEELKMLPPTTTAGDASTEIKTLAAAEKPKNAAAARLKRLLGADARARAARFVACASHVNEQRD